MSHMSSSLISLIAGVALLAGGTSQSARAYRRRHRAMSAIAHATGGFVGSDRRCHADDWLPCASLSSRVRPTGGVWHESSKDRIRSAGLLVGAAARAGSLSILTDERDADGFFVSHEQHLVRPPSFAIVSEDVDALTEAPGWLADWLTNPVDVRVKDASGRRRRHLPRNRRLQRPRGVSRRCARRRGHQHRLRGQRHQIPHP